MKKFTVKTLNYILLSVLAFVFLVLSCFGLGNMGAPSSYYSTGNYEVNKYNALVFQLQYEGDEKLDSVWVNFGSKDYYNKQEVLNVYSRMATNSSSSMVEVSQQNFVASDIIVGGWIQIADSSDIGSSSTREFFMLAFNGRTKIKVNEIAFVASDSGALTKLKATGYASGQKDSLYDTLDKSSTLHFDDAGKRDAQKLVDENDKFSISRINGAVYDNDQSSLLTATEILMAESAKNLVDGNGSYLVTESNSLGGYLIALGGAIFGYNAVGMRVIPMLFAVGTIVLLFFIGTLVTKKEICGLLLAFLYATNGYSLAYATYCNVASIFVFFVCLTLYFAFRFYRNGVNYKAPAKGVLNLLLAGVAFTGALLVKSQAVFLAPVIIAIVVCAIIRQYKKYRKTVLEQHPDRDIKTVNRRFAFNVLPQGGVVFAGFILLPLLAMVCTFLIAYPAFSVYYNSSSLFGYMTAHFKNGFIFGSQVNGGMAILNTAVVNYGNRFIFGNLLNNYLTLASVLGAFGYLIYTLICKKVQNQTKTNTFVYPLIAILLGFVSFAICYGVFTAFGEAVEIYMCANLFASFSAVLLFGALENDYNKAVFTVKGQSVTVTGLVTMILALAITVMWALATPALLGLSDALVHVNAIGFIAKGKV